MQLIEDRRSVGAKSCIRTRLTCVLEHSLVLSQIERGGGLCCHSVTIERRFQEIANFWRPRPFGLLQLNPNCCWNWSCLSITIAFQKKMKREWIIQLFYFNLLMLEKRFQLLEYNFLWYKKQVLYKKQSSTSPNKPSNKFLSALSEVNLIV